MSNNNHKANRGASAAKKQTMIDGTNPSRASIASDEVNGFPNIILNKAMVKELHILQEKMTIPSI